MSKQKTSSIDRVTKDLKNRLEAELDDQEVVLQNESLTKDDLVQNCPKCGAQRVARSRLQGSDNLRMQFLPKRPYRCLHCYNRFWSREPFMADKRRPIVWSILALVLLVLALKNPFSSLDSDANLSGNNSLIVGEKGPSAEQRARIEGVNASIYQDEVPVTPPAKAGELRKIIEASKFSVPDSAQLQSKLNPIVEPTPVDTEAPAEVSAEPAQPAAAPSITSSVQGNLTSTPIETNNTENESLLRVAVSSRIEGWRKAWQQGDSGKYLNFYGVNFVPKTGLTPTAWRQQRIARISPERDIKLELSNFKVDFTSNYRRCVVRFDQRYQANTYLDNSRKELVWELQDGVWNIVLEKEVAGG